MTSWGRPWGAGRTPIKLRLEKGDIAFSKVLPHGGPQIYIDELEKAFHAKKKIQNCFLCRHHGENIFRDKDEGPIYCKFLNKNTFPPGQYHVSITELVQERSPHKTWLSIGYKNQVIPISVPARNYPDQF